MPRRPLQRLLVILGPGVLVAATGVGAGDLAMAAFAGSQLGLGVLWVAVLGAALKLVLNENIARWQIATGETVLAGALERFGRPLQVLFIAYLLPWTFFTCGALMSACGVALGTLTGLTDSETARIGFGIACSLLGVVLVRIGGFALFERLMLACIGLMVAAVVVTAALSEPDWGAVARGLLVPRVRFSPEELRWSVALMAGVGGTLTILCYGYWMRACGRTDASDLRRCRVDLALAYGMTALFSIAMIIIAHDLPVQGKGARLIADLGASISGTSGPLVGTAFVVGAFGAIFSSLLGVWQSVPLIFEETLGAVRPTLETRARQRAASWFQIALATVPAAGLLLSFKQAQLFYALSGALFIPALAGIMLLMNRRREMGRFRNGTAMSVLLAACLVALGAASVLSILNR